MTQVEKLFNVSVNNVRMSSESFGKVVKQKLRSCFDIFWKDEIYAEKLDLDGINHNKLRLYSTLKNSFSREPYVDNVFSRNQRSWISRVRSSSTRLGIEIGRYKNMPISSRVCKYCSSGEIDDEFHCMMFCPIFDIKRACSLGKWPLFCLILCPCQMNKNSRPFSAQHLRLPQNL